MSKVKSRSSTGGKLLSWTSLHEITSQESRYVVRAVLDAMRSLDGEYKVKSQTRHVDAFFSFSNKGLQTSKVDSIQIAEKLLVLRNSLMGRTITK
jgi:aspartate aminotransferase-like enzyme